MKTIICGSRHFAAPALMKRVMANLRWSPTEVISGCAPGADTYGEKWAASNRISVKQFPANWKTYGRAAGPIRNKQMAKYGDACVAFLYAGSRGTKNMIHLATIKGMPLCIVYCDEDGRIEYTGPSVLI